MKVILSLTMNPALDTNSNAEQVVADRKLPCIQPCREPGGGGINVSRAVQRLGGKSLAPFPAGGTTGQLPRDLLTEESINIHPVPVTEETRENITVREQSSDRQY